jgi:hypothetical protein
MLDRREFLIKSLGAGAVIATVGLRDVPGAFAGTSTRHAPGTHPAKSRPPTGYRVGQSVPHIVGMDQYGGTAGLATYKDSWVLIDLCPWWCIPCQRSATDHAAFSRYINSHDIRFRILSVVVESLQLGRASTRFDAERWAESFGLQRNVVLHCNNDGASPLRNLAEQFATANGDTETAYPTYVLVDPHGVVRHYQTGTDLGEVQAKLASFTGKTLTQTWTPGPPLGLGLPHTRNVTGIVVIAKRADGTTIDETITLTNHSPDLAVVDASRLPLGNFSEILTTISDDPNSPSANFDPDTPITMSFLRSSPPVGVPYTRITHVGNALAFAPNDAITESVDVEKVIPATGTLGKVDDGVMLTAPSITSLLNGVPEHGRQWSTMWFDDSRGTQRWAMAYSLTETLIDDVANSGLTKIIKPVTHDLHAVLNKLTAREFRWAAGLALSAAARLRRRANEGLRADADWLAAHLKDIAEHR